MCQTDQCSDFGIRRRRIVETTDAEAEELSPYNCEYNIICNGTGPVLFSGKLEFIKILLE
jgi:hypothetical protein